MGPWPHLVLPATGTSAATASRHQTLSPLFQYRIHLKCLMLCDYSWALQAQTPSWTRTPAWKSELLLRRLLLPQQKQQRPNYEATYANHTQVKFDRLTKGRTNQARQKCSTPKWANKHRPSSETLRKIMQTVNYEKKN